MSSNNCDFDAIVIGSGLTGGWAAKELTEQGLKVLVLERGEDYPQLAGTVQTVGEEDAESQKRLKQLYQDEYAIQHQSYVFNETTRHIFNNDKDDPYIRNPEKPFNWIRTQAVGGKSLLWAGGAYRWSDLDFNAHKRDGHGIDWPIRYKDLEKWYAYVECFIGISGANEELPYLPDGEFLPAMAYSGLEADLRQALCDNFDNRILTIGRIALLTADHNGRRAYDKYAPQTPAYLTESLFSSKNSTLPAAEKTGNLTLKANMLVEALEYDKAQKRISAVMVIDTRTGTRQKFTAAMVFLCASTIDTTRILLNSRSDTFPYGLGNTSGVLGHYLMDHISVLSAVGTKSDATCTGTENHNLNRPNISYIPRFQNLEKTDVPFDRGYGYVCWEGKVRASYSQPVFGSEGIDLNASDGASAFTLMGYGECLPYYGNTIGLDHRQADRFGIPLVNIEYSWGKNEQDMVDHMAKEGEAILKKCGFEQIVCNRVLPVAGSAVHEMGTARMGWDPDTSFLNGLNQSHVIPNLFVTDGACMTSSSNLHPSLTYMALTARAASYAVAKFREGSL